MATLRELVTGKGWDATQGIIEEVSKLVPELNFFDAKIIPGTTFKGLKLVSDPTTGFRTIGNGIDASDEDYSLVSYELAYLAGIVKRDKAAFEADLTGRDAALARAATAVVRSGMKTLAAAIWYGDSTSKFSGVSALVKAGLVVNAGGSTANAQTSVYLVGNNAEDACGLVFNQDSKLLGATELEWKEQLGTGANSKDMPVLYTDLGCWCGFAVRNSNAVGRIANLESGHALTDALLADAVSKYQEANDGLAPAAIFAPFSQIRALRTDRSTKVYNGPRDSKENLAAAPTDFDGIPIIGTNSIRATEAVYSAA